MPMPVSFTVTAKVPEWRSNELLTLMLSPDCVNFSALFIRFISTCYKRVISPLRKGRLSCSSSTSTESATFLPEA